MKTVLCHGVFDVLHAGHLAYFEEAKRYGEKLIVSITADRYVNKGPGRPYFGAERRARMVGALRPVDEVYLSDEPTGLGAIAKFRPDYYVKGPDYRDLSKDITGEILNEKKAVESYGGKLVFTEAETYSSSTLINKFFSSWSDEQRATIDKVKSLGGLNAVERAIEKLGSLRVLVIGEPITDIYRFCDPEGISSKSPTVSARFAYEEVYEGGATAIHKHLSGFVKTDALYYTDDPPNKIRYISQEKAQRIFEVTHIDESRWLPRKGFNHLAKLYDVVVAADFGHGLFNQELLSEMEEVKAFIGLNVQTNSSNFGFNVCHKHKRFDYLCLDTREARLAQHDRHSPAIDIAHSVHRKIKRPLSITLGSHGSILLDSDIEFKAPAFSDVVIDATGAGDAYFAITTVLMASGCHQALIPFIGNVFAGLKTRIIGNKSAVSKASLLKAIRAILA